MDKAKGKKYSIIYLNLYYTFFAAPISPHCQLNQFFIFLDESHQLLNFFQKKDYKSGLYIRGCTQPIITKFIKKEEHNQSPTQTKNYCKQQFCFHPPFTSSIAIISKWPSIKDNRSQNRSQYVPLKIICKIEPTLILLKIILFRHLQMAQHTAATPIQIKFLIFLD